MAEVTLDVAPRVAKLLEDQSYAELVFREKNRRFDFFTKGLVTNTSSENASNAISDAVSDMSLTKMRRVCSQFDEGGSSISARLGSLDSATKAMAVNADKLIMLTRVTGILSFLNMALSLVNIGVSVVGFKRISKDLSGLSSELKEIKSSVSKLVSATESEKISDCEKLIMRFNSVSDHIQNDDVKDLDELQNLLIDMNGYLSEMIRNMINNVFSVEDTLELILRITPAYSILLADFLRRYFFKYGKRPNNYDTFIDLYSEFFQQTVTKTLQDYFMINKNVNYLDAMDVINSVRLLALNGRTGVEDQILLAEKMETEEEYKQVDIELAALVQKEAMQA